MQWLLQSENWIALYGQKDDMVDHFLRPVFVYEKLLVGQGSRLGFVLKISEFRASKKSDLAYANFCSNLLEGPLYLHALIPLKHYVWKNLLYTQCIYNSDMRVENHEQLVGRAWNTCRQLSWGVSKMYGRCTCFILPGE